MMRNAFDVLRSVPPEFTCVDGSDADASWSQWHQRAAPGPSRKRAAGMDAAAVPAVTTPRWADAAAQRRKFSDAWLSFLRLQLPVDVYKVRRRASCGDDLCPTC